MHATTLRALVISLLTATSLVGCGKESVPSQDTTAAKKSADTAADTDKNSSDDAKDESKDDAAPSKEKSKSKASKKKDDMTVERKAKDYLTAPDVVFMYTFNESDAKRKAEKDCGDRSKGDQEKQGKCMAEAQKKFGADGYHFQQDDQGKWWWEVVKFKNGVVTYVHRVPIEFTNEGDTSVTVKVVGKDEAKGAKGYVPSEVKFEVPNGYQIVHNDPDEGKVVLEAKLGLLGDSGGSKKKR